MKELLEQYFGAYYGSTRTNVYVDTDDKTGEFRLCDSKACNDCLNKTPKYENDCDHTVLKCKSDDNIKVFWIEKFIDEFNNLRAMPTHSKCDIMMSNDNTIVFCDMSCSKPEYIDDFQSNGKNKLGKRNKAKNQIEDTIYLLMNVPEIASEINKKGHKIGLFAYREKHRDDLSDTDSKVFRNMNSFGSFIAKATSGNLSSPLSHGFQFTEINYPSIFSF